MKEAFDKLLEAYEMLGECIPQFQQYEQIFNQPYMDSILELFYGDILEFHRRALKVFNRRGQLRFTFFFIVLGLNNSRSRLEIDLQISMERFRDIFPEHS